MVRIGPEQYFQSQQTQEPKVEYVYVPQYIKQEEPNQTYVTPKWVQALVFVCVLSTVALAFYALSKVD